MQYDLLLRGGRVIDPAQNIDGLFDVAIQDGKIAAVAASILPSSAKEVVNVAASWFSRASSTRMATSSST